MSSLHPARRRAERFDSLLEREPGAGTSKRDLELLEVVGALTTLPRPEPRAAFTADLRERLMVAAETELVAGTDAQTDARFRDLTDRLTIPNRRTPRERRLAIALGGFAMVGATTSMAVAAQHALPGDTLYPLKRAMENAEAGFRVSDSAKGTTILANASGRLDEVRSLSQTNEVDADAVATTLDNFAQQATEASELLLDNFAATGSQTSINELRDFTASSIETLAALEPVIPAQAQESLLAAAQTILAIDGQAAFLCPECSSLGIITVPTQLVADVAEQVQVPVEQQGGPGKAPLPKQPREPRTSADAVEPSAQPSQPGLPTQQQPDQGDKGPHGSKGSQGPLINLPSGLPSVGVTNPGEVVEDVVSGVGDVVNGLTGSNKTSE